MHFRATPKSGFCHLIVSMYLKVRSAIYLSILLAAVSLLSLPAFAQSNELGVTVGGYFPINSPVSADTAFAIGGSFAHRVASVPLVSLYFEVPAFGTFNSTANIVGSTLTRPKYSALFVTPGLKLKLAPSFPVSPYFVAGGGLAHFSKSNVATSDTTNTGVFDVGGGLDFKIAPYVGLRTEVRDFYSGSPNVTTNFTSREHQLIASAGLVLRF
jgi:opacity protein-like surface antigen